MDLPFELHIALRYLLAKRKQAFISLISLVSTLGVTVGVMAVIIALAVMTGLQQALRDQRQVDRLLVLDVLPGRDRARMVARGREQVPQLHARPHALAVGGQRFVQVAARLLGTRMAGGCTSGHGIFGMSNFELPSLITTVSFMIGGIVPIAELVAQTTAEFRSAA